MIESHLLATAATWHDNAVTLPTEFDVPISGSDASMALAEIVAGVRQGELAICLAVERVDRSGEFAADGAASTNAYLRTLANETGDWGRRRILVGRALIDRLPATLAAWAAGHLGLEHAWQITEATKDVVDLELLAQLDRILAGATPALSPTDLRKLGERIRAQEMPEQTAKNNADQRSSQKLTMSQTMNGMWDLHARFGPEAGILIKNVIDSFTPRPTADEILADPAGSMSPAERRAQALQEICRQAQDHAEGCNGKGGGRGTLIVAVPLADLQTGVGVGEVSGGSTLPAAALRRWACDIGIIPMILGADSEILDFGRRTRAISAGLLAYLVARDGGCVFPGCDRPPAWTEAHHRIHWLVGGPTDKINLDLLCVAHHHACHEGGWTIEIAGDVQRTPWFHPPGGRAPLPGQRRPLIPLPRQKTDQRPQAERSRGLRT